MFIKIQIRKYLLCNGPWPSYFRLQIVRKRSCPAEKFVRTVRIARNPLFPVRGRREQPEAHIYSQTLHCNRPKSNEFNTQSNSGYNDHGYNKQNLLTFLVPSSILLKFSWLLHNDVTEIANTYWWSCIELSSLSLSLILFLCPQIFCT